MSAPPRANAEQIENWNTESGLHWVAEAARFDAMLAPFLTPILDAAALAPGGSVLDVGCGNGALTCAAGAHVGDAGRAVGVDISRPMLDYARQRPDARDATHVSFVEADAQVADLGALDAAPFDTVVSRFGVMFFDDSVAAFANLRAGVRAGGCLAVLTWQPMLANPWLVETAAPAIEILGMPEADTPGTPGMFQLSDPDHVRALLAAAGWRDVELTSVAMPLRIGGGLDVDAALDFIATGGPGRRLLALAQSDEQREEALDAVRAVLERNVVDGVVELGAACWLVCARNA